MEEFLKGLSRFEYHTRVHIFAKKEYIDIIVYYYEKETSEAVQLAKHFDPSYSDKYNEYCKFIKAITLHLESILEFFLYHQKLVRMGPDGSTIYYDNEILYEYYRYRPSLSRDLILEKIKMIKSKYKDEFLFKRNKLQARGFDLASLAYAQMNYILKEMDAKMDNGNYEEELLSMILYFYQYLEEIYKDSLLVQQGKRDWERNNKKFFIE